MTVFERFALYVILTSLLSGTSLQTNSTGTATNSKHLVLQATSNEVLKLTCKVDSNVEIVRWIANDALIALTHGNRSTCSLTDGNDNRFTYSCNDEGFQLTIPANYIEDINGSTWVCRDPRGGVESNPLTVLVIGSSEECKLDNINGSAEKDELTKRIDSTKKWLIIASSVAVVLFIATVMLVTDKLKSKHRGASLKENSGIIRNTDDVPGPSTLRYTGSNRENAMHIPSDLNHVPDTEHAIRLPLQSVDGALSLQNIESTKSLLSHNDDITNTMEPNYVPEFHNGMYSYAEIRDARKNLLSSEATENTDPFYHTLMASPLRCPQRM